MAKQPAGEDTSVATDLIDIAADPPPSSQPKGPPLPPGESIELPGRGTTFVRTLPGPTDAPTVLLLHGWTATSDVNWFRQYAPLGEHYRVIAIDHRGHGRGIRSRRRFRLADCADDAMAACDVLGIRRVIPIGYSMGGPVAQLIWHRHKQRTRGLVLAATAGSFSASREERLAFIGLSGLAVLARLTPAQARVWLTEQFYLQRKADAWGEWAISEAALNNWRTVLEAGQAIGTFSSKAWLGEIDVPTSVIITIRDQVVPVRRQERLFETIPGAEAFRVDGMHDAVVNESVDFTTPLLRAVHSVVERSSL